MREVSGVQGAQAQAQVRQVGKQLAAGEGAGQAHLLRNPQPPQQHAQLAGAPAFGTTPRPQSAFVERNNCYREQPAPSAALSPRSSTPSETKLENVVSAVTLLHEIMRCTTVAQLAGASAFTWLECRRSRAGGGLIRSGKAQAVHNLRPCRRLDTPIGAPGFWQIFSFICTLTPPIHAHGACSSDSSFPRQSTRQRRPQAVAAYWCTPGTCSRAASHYLLPDAEHDEAQASGLEFSLLRVYLG